MTPAFLAIPLVAALLGADEEARHDLRPRPTVGSTSAWTLETTIDRSVGFRGMPAEATGVHLKLEWTTKVTEAAKGEFTVICDVTDVALKLTSSAEKVEYDSRTPKQPATGPFAPCLNELMQAELTAVIDSNGALKSLKGLELTLEGIPPRGAIRAALLDATSENTWRTALTEAFGAGGGRPNVRDGDDWKVETSRPLLLASYEPLGRLTVKSKRELDDVDESIASCTIRNSVRAEVEGQGLRPGESTVEDREGSGKGTASIDLVTGEVIKLDTQWTLQTTVKPERSAEQVVSVKESMVLSRARKEATPKQQPPIEPEIPDEPVRRFH